MSRSATSPASAGRPRKSPLRLATGGQPSTKVVRPRPDWACRACCPGQDGAGRPVQGEDPGGRRAPEARGDGLEAVNRYTNRTLSTAEIIAELVELAKQMRDDAKRHEALGLREDEIAFYDAIAQNDSAVLDFGAYLVRAREYPVNGGTGSAAAESPSHFRQWVRPGLGDPRCARNCAGQRKLGDHRTWRLGCAVRINHIIAARTMNPIAMGISCQLMTVTGT
jgi:restriction endonuclease HindI-like protein